MAGIYDALSRGVESGFSMGRQAAQDEESKRARKVQEERQAADDVRRAEGHELDAQRARFGLEQAQKTATRQEDTYYAGILEGRATEIDKEAAERQARGLPPDESLAQERARIRSGLAQVQQKARDYFSYAKVGKVDPTTTPGPELRMHLTAATGMTPGEITQAAGGVDDILAGMESQNWGLVTQGTNKAMLHLLKRGVGAASPYGGTITRKEIIGLDPAIDAAGNEHPNRFIPRMRVYVEGVSPTGGEMYYDAPMTKEGSTDPQDPVAAFEIGKSMDWAANLKMLAEMVSRPDMQEKLKPSGAQDEAQRYIEMWRTPKKELVTSGGQAFIKEGPNFTRIEKPETPAEAALREQRAATAAVNRARVDGTLPAPKKAGGGGAGGGAGGSGGGTAKGLSGITAANAHLRGDEFLATLDPETAQAVRSIAAGNDPKGFSSRSNTRGKLEAMAQMYSEGYTSKIYPTAAATEKAFATGVEGRKVRSFNVVIQHLDSLERLAEALQNPTDLPLINKLSLQVQEQLGRAPPTNFEAARDLIADEIVAAVVPGVGALADRKAAADKIKAARSTEQLRGALHVYHDLLGGQLVGMEQQYKAGGGAKDFRAEFLNARSREIAARVAPPTATPAPAAGGLPARPAGVPPAAPGGLYSDAEKERRYQAWKAQQAGR